MMKNPPQHISLSKTDAKALVRLMEAAAAIIDEQCHRSSQTDKARMLRREKHRIEHKIQQLKTK